MEDRQTLIALNAAERIHRAALCRLAATLDDWRRLDDPERARRHAPALGLPGEVLARAVALKERAAPLAAAELERAEACRCRVLVRGENDYPAALLDHPLPPPVLYLRGELPRAPAVAIVGSRGMTPYGRRAAQHFARQLAGAGVVVVSGFARGVDTAAHRAALDAGGLTVAVLGCGIDVDYPRGNTELGVEIGHHGALLSEFPLASPPRSWHFPMRNRVIAALAASVVVIEAAPRSGSLITAHLALELGRDVYAVPGSIFEPLCEGTNELIADGALVARGPDDVLTALPLALQQQLFPVAQPARSPAIRESAGKPALTAAPALKGFAGKLHGALSEPPPEPTTADDLAEQLGVAVDKVLAGLLELELAGAVRRLPGPLYEAVRL